MSVDVAVGRAVPRTVPVTADRASLRLIGEPHPALGDQEQFVARAERVLRRAEASGQRLATALFLVLREHRGVPRLDAEHRLHLTCTECRPDGRRPEEQYPCPTAEQAFWALDAVLS